MILRAILRPGPRRRTGRASPISGSSAPAAAGGCRIVCRDDRLGRAGTPAPQRELPRAGHASPSAGPARRVAQPVGARRRAGPRRATPLRGGAKCAEFGDERGPADTLPRRGRSLLAPALLAAAPRRTAPVIVVTRRRDRGRRRHPARAAAPGRPFACCPGRRGPTSRSRASPAPPGSPPVTRFRSSSRSRHWAAPRADSVTGGGGARREASRRPAAPRCGTASARGRLAFSLVGRRARATTCSACRLVDAGDAEPRTDDPAAPRHGGAHTGRRAHRGGRPIGTAGFSTGRCARWPSSRSAGSPDRARAAGARWPTSRSCRPRRCVRRPDERTC